AVGRRPLWLGHRLGLRPLRGWPRHLLGVRHDGRWRAWRALFPRHQGYPLRVLGLLRELHAALLRERRRQRIDVPDDPRDHAQGGGTARTRFIERRAGEAKRQGIGSYYRLPFVACRLRRLLHPEELRPLVPADRRRASGAVVLLPLLSALLAHPPELFPPPRRPPS